MRATLKTMYANGDITKEDSRIYYRQAKGHLFKNTPSMIAHIARKAAERQRAQESQAEALRIGGVKASSK